MAPETSEQAAVREITPQEAFDELKSNDAILVDTREPHEYSEAHIDGANLVPPAMLSEKIANVAPDKSGRVILRGDAVWNVPRDDVHPGPGLRCCQLPRHRHRASERRIIRDEIDSLHDTTWRHDLDEARIDRVALSGRLAMRCRRVVIGEHEAI